MNRSTFVYLDPKGNPNDFAQCRSCKMYVDSHDVCSLHGMKVKVHGGMSCTEYAFGHADDSELPHVSPAFTPEQSGLVDAEVRCENCHFFESEENECELFHILNIPDKVNPKGCCNAWESAEKDEASEKKLKRKESAEKPVLKKNKNPFED